MKRIPESELIISPEGKIYHLNLLPHQVAETIISVGDPDRVSEVSKYFDSVEFKVKKREFTTHTGLIGRKRLTVISTGIGTDNIDIVLNELDALFNIDLKERTIKEKITPLNIIRIGTSGSLRAEIPVDSFLISTYGIGIDGLLGFYKYQPDDEEMILTKAFREHVNDLEFIPTPFVMRGSEKLIRIFGQDVHRGMTVTNTGFYGPQGRTLRMGINYPHLIDRVSGFQKGEHKVTNFEMETAALYGMSRILGHECVSLSAIVANRVNGTFSKNPDAAIDKLIQMVLGRIV